MPESEKRRQPNSYVMPTKELLKLNALLIALFLSGYGKEKNMSLFRCMTDNASSTIAIPKSMYGSE